MEHNRLDLELLDERDPFEIDDDNRPHLLKHGPFDVDDLYDAWAFDAPLFYPAADGGAADWLMVAEVPGELLVAPLARARSGDPRRCRPIGLYRPSRRLTEQYREDTR